MTSAEDRLRAAITHRTSAVEPSPDALHEIEERLMDAQRSTNRNRLLLAVAATAAAVAIVVGVLALTDEDTVDTAGTTTTEATTSSSTSTTEATTTTLPSAGVDASVPVFPDATSSRRFDDPVALAQTFATEVLGFVDPVMGELAQGDSRSGEVEVRGFAEGRPTVVLVRQLEDDTWFVIGAVVESIRLDVPEQGATLTSPQALEGAAMAFEGHVAVRLYVDGDPEPVAETFVTGRGDGVMGDFAGELVFDVPDGVAHGVLVLFEPSAKDGSTIAATVIRVHF